MYLIVTDEGIAYFTKEISHQVEQCQNDGTIDVFRWHEGQPEIYQGEDKWSKVGEWDDHDEEDEDLDLHDNPFDDLEYEGDEDL